MEWANELDGYGGLWKNVSNQLHNIHVFCKYLISNKVSCILKSLYDLKENVFKNG
jgi:hypothetical protein